MVAIVAMILGYLLLSDLKVAVYIGLGFLLAKWLITSIYNKEQDRYRCMYIEENKENKEN